MNQRVRDLFRSMQPESRRACLECVQDDAIRTLFTGPVGTCLACGREDKPTVDVQRLATLVQNDAPSRYEVDPELYSGYSGMELEEVIAQMVLCESPVILQEIASLLVVDDQGEDPDNPSFFWQGNTYRQIGSPFESDEDERDYVVSRWEQLTSALMHQHRFFNKDAEEFFAQIFQEALRINTNTVMGELPAAPREIPAGFTLYRARIASTAKIQKDIRENPAAQMGAPPSATAANNRMNPAGISLFYGSTKQETCVAEVRPSIGDKVAVARFVTTKPLKLFDFHGLDRHLRFPRISPFEDAPTQRRVRQLFLQYLHHEIAKPARNDGMSYIVTQAMTEFFAKEYGSDFAGFCFQSVQKKGGQNIVLFGQSDTAAGYNPSWEPTFPVVLDGSVTYVDVTAVAYRSEASKSTD